MFIRAATGNGLASLGTDLITPHRYVYIEILGKDKHTPLTPCTCDYRWTQQHRQADVGMRKLNNFNKPAG